MPQTLTLTDALRTIDLLQDLDDHQIQWLADHVEEVHAVEGEAILREGEPADSLLFVFEGGIRFQRESVPDSPAFFAEAGEVSGKLPFSRMSKVGGTGRAIGNLWLGRLREVNFEEMLRVIPPLNQRLVSLMADLFIPWGLAGTGDGAPALAGSAILYLLKIGALATALAVTETAMAKLRIFRVPDLMGTAFALALLSLAAETALHA